jgi:hypothetical protein
MRSKSEIEDEFNFLLVFPCYDNFSNIYIRNIIMKKNFHEKFVLVPADKVCNNIVFVCKAHYYNCILNELGIITTFDNPTYTPIAIKSIGPF